MPGHPAARGDDRVQPAAHVDDLDERVRGDLVEEAAHVERTRRGRRAHQVAGPTAYLTLEATTLDLQAAGLVPALAGLAEPAVVGTKRRERLRHLVVGRPHAGLGQPGRAPALAPPQQAAGGRTHGGAQGDGGKLFTVPAGQRTQLGAPQGRAVGVQRLETAATGQQHPTAVIVGLTVQGLREPGRGPDHGQPVGASRGRGVQGGSGVPGREAGDEQPRLRGLVGGLAVELPGDVERRRRHAAIDQAGRLASPQLGQVRAHREPVPPLAPVGLPRRAGLGQRQLGFAGRDQGVGATHVQVGRAHVREPTSVEASLHDCGRLGCQAGGEQHVGPIHGQLHLIEAEVRVALGCLVVQPQRARQVAADVRRARLVVQRDRRLDGLPLGRQLALRLDGGLLGTLRLPDDEVGPGEVVEGPRLPQPVSACPGPRQGALQVGDRLAVSPEDGGQHVAAPHPDRRRERRARGLGRGAVQLTEPGPGPT